MNKFHNAFGFVRLAAATPLLRVADCTYNTEGVLSLMDKAERRSIRVLVLPELTLTGYTCRDLFQQSTLRVAVLNGLQRIVAATTGPKPLYRGLLLVGAPLEMDGMLFNCAVVIQGGTILGVVPKSLLPTYKEFEEWRWFRPAAKAGDRKSIELFGQQVPFGVDLLFADNTYPNLVVGVEICEDLWGAVPPSSLQALHGATVLVNLSASNEIVGKANYRRQLVSQQSGRCIAAYVYASSGPSESTTDVVFGGHNLIAKNGSLVVESDRFASEPVLTVAEVDLEELINDRMRTNSFGDSASDLGLERKFRRIQFSLPAQRSPFKVVQGLEAHPFVPKGKALAERCQEIFAIQVAGLAKRLSHVGTKHVTIGVSGGLDSTLALLVALKTFQKLGWSPDRIHGYTMPGFGTTSRTKGNAHALMSGFGLTAKEVDIRSMCIDEMLKTGHKPFGIDLQALRNRAELKAQELCRKSLPNEPSPSARELELELFSEELSKLGPGAEDLVFENVQARMRTLILMTAGFTLGTGDLSELALGWCTYNGDHMSGYNVNVSIPKTLVKFLVAWAAENQFDGAVRATLHDVVGTEISPELLPAGKDGKIQQKTESVVGPYELHDFFMYYTLRHGFSPEKILYLASQVKFNQQYSDQEREKWLKVFISRFFSQQFKRSALPDGPKVGSVSLSPRGDWRMPSDASAFEWLRHFDLV